MAVLSSSSSEIWVHHLKNVELFEVILHRIVRVYFLLFSGASLEKHSLGSFRFLGSRFLDGLLLTGGLLLVDGFLLENGMLFARGNLLLLEDSLRGDRG